MKIIQIIQKPQARGAELFACLLATHLEKLGHELILVSVFSGDFEMPFEGRQIHLNRPLKARLWDLKGWKAFADIVKKEAPDLIQANAADTLKFSVFSKKLFRWKAPLIFNNGSIVSQYISNPLIKRLNQYLLDAVDHIVAVNEYVKTDLAHFFDREFTQTVIPIGIDTANPITIQPSVNYPVLVHIGGFTFEKNHQGLLRIFREFLKHEPKAQLWLYGSGPLKSAIETQVQTEFKRGQVFFKRYQEKPFAQLPSNSIVLLPSLIEGLPSVILEALCFGFPVLAYKVGGIEDLLAESHPDYLVDKENEKAFVSQLISLMKQSESQKNQLIESGKRLVQNNYTLEKAAKSFEKLYQSLIQR